ncbi:MAG: chemotaxis protein CheD [Candidatus Schekmanbacteria bacterium]|nr:MAG: chemotaxis protein CheD [Candidatus Schekmanbacteria bacterium]
MIHTVGLADMKISSSKEDIIITHGLGSCLGITVYDPLAHIGGMLHVMLPFSNIDPERAKEKPFMFVDTGLPKLFISCYEMGASKDRLIVTVCGGANPLGMSNNKVFNIGERNFAILQKLLDKNNVSLAACDIGGTQSRTMTLEIATGRVSLKINGYENKVLFDASTDKSAQVFK